MVVLCFETISSPLPSPEGRFSGSSAPITDPFATLAPVDVVKCRYLPGCYFFNAPIDNVGNAEVH